ncbi:mannose-1-phosphate guanyltransferase beta-like, partial [Cyclospora cayetanensis]|uniref:Mannose-1-phosphate guanyltransferase beta-like n=1 Tax=Cyclospora cayetanensis TaxID=88456 RepID=A0A6P6RPG6_9EIME
MKALILVGGYGTRLRPLTLSVPKPLINFCNRSIVEYQIASFKKVGVKHLILAVAYQPEALMEALRDLEKKYALKISCSKEDDPLGTAGPVRLAEKLLRDEDAEKSSPQPSAGGRRFLDIKTDTDCFFVCNSDIICSFPLEEMWKFHKKTGAEATIL